jgi:threonine/homoserine/homoserine lactone efflux protein
MAMVESILFGSSLAFAAAVQPGPLQAFLLSSIVRNGWKRTLPASLAPLLSDAPVALLALLVLTHLPEMASRGLRAAGGVLLLVLAWSAYRHWRRPSPDAPSSVPAPRTLLQAAFVNVLNPGPWLGWTLVLGPAVLAAWRSGPAHAVALLVAFYATMVAANAGIILLLGTTRFLGPGARRALVLLSALALAALGVYQLIISILGTIGP